MINSTVTQIDPAAISLPQRTRLTSQISSPRPRWGRGKPHPRSPSLVSKPTYLKTFGVNDGQSREFSSRETQAGCSCGRSTRDKFAQTGGEPSFREPVLADGPFSGRVCVRERDYGTPIASAMAVPTAEGVNAVVSITSASAPSHPRNALSYRTR